MRTEPKVRILEAFSRFGETSRRGTGSAIGDPRADLSSKPRANPNVELVWWVFPGCSGHNGMIVASSRVPLETISRRIKPIAAIEREHTEFLQGLRSETRHQVAAGLDASARVNTRENVRLTS